MNRRSFIQTLGSLALLGIPGLAQAKPKVNVANPKILKAPGVATNVVFPKVHCRPQVTADDLSWEMQCWGKGVLDQHDEIVMEARSRLSKDWVNAPLQRFAKEPSAGGYKVNDHGQLEYVPVRA